MVNMSAKRKRIIALDIMRGYFLLVILIDHLGLFPSPFELLTGRGQLWASAAEGFFLISGLLVGYIYAGRIGSHFWQSTRKLFKRAGLLYAWAVIITLVMVVWGNAVGEALAKDGLWTNPPVGELLVQTLSLQYTYGWADFLRYYAVYMAFAPLALWLCVRSYAWVALALSAAVWVLWREHYYAAIQLLFMIGIVIGFYLPALQKRFKKLAARNRRRLAAFVGAAAAGTLLLSVLTERVATTLVARPEVLGALPAWAQDSVRRLFELHEFVEPLVSKWTLGPLRIVVALLWFTALYALVRRYEQQIDRITRGSLRVIGENSLLVYIAHAFLVFGALLYIRPGSIVDNTVVTIIGIVGIYAVARYREIPGRFVQWAGERFRRQPRPLQLLSVLAILSLLIFGGWAAYSAVAAGWAEPSSATSKSSRVTARAAVVDTTPGEIKKDVPYCNGQRLDLYEPRTLRFYRSPVVMYLHGGGWVLNDKASEPDQLAFLDGLRDAGYSVVSINYSKVPSAYYPAPIQESLCAVRFLRANAERFYLDKQNIAVYGFSAGGYLAAAVGVLPDDSPFETAEYDTQSSRVQAVITLAGLFDFADGLNIGNRERITQFLRGSDPERADIMSYISSDDPPFLLVHGAQDVSVPIAQDELMAAGLQAQGAVVERLVVQNAEHGLNPSGGEPVPSREEVKQAMTDFIRAHMDEPIARPSKR